MKTQVDWKRIGIFIAFAFGIAWASALVIALTGGLINSPVLIQDTPITLAMVLMATAYMCAPAVAHVLTRWLSKEGWQDVQLRPHLHQAWPYWLVAWIGPAILTVLGGALYFLLFPQHLMVT